MPAITRNLHVFRTVVCRRPAMDSSTRRAGRTSNYQFGCHVVIRAFATFQLQHLIQGLEGYSAHFLAWDANGSQGWPGQESEGNVVDANHGNVPGNVNARLLK